MFYVLIHLFQELQRHNTIILFSFDSSVNKYIIEGIRSSNDTNYGGDLV